MGCRFSSCSEGPIWCDEPRARARGARASAPLRAASSLALVATMLVAVGLARAEAAQPPPAQTERADTEALARRTAERIRRLQQEADALAARERTLLVELRRLEVDRQLRNEELARLDGELTDLARQLEATAARLRALDAAIGRQRPEIAARLVALYKLGRPGYGRVLLGARDVRSFGRTYRLVAALAALDRQKLEQYRRSLADLRAAEQALAARRAQALRLQEEARRTRAALDRAIAAQNDLIRAIDEQRDLNAQLLGELQGAYSQLQATLAGLSSPPSSAAAPAGRLSTGSPEASSSAGAPAPPGSGLLATHRGQVDWPVAGRLLTPFGRHQTRSGTTLIRNGIEISAPEGALVRAVAPGQVAFADTFTGFGNLVILDHGRQTYSLYGYLEALEVARGDRVEAGAPLGTVGRTFTGAPALYFELRIDGKPVDPLQWLRKSASR